MYISSVLISKYICSNSLIFICLVVVVQFDISRRPWYTALFNFSLEDPDTFRDTGSGSGQNGSPRKNDSARGSRGDPTEDDSTLLPRVSRGMFCHVKSCHVMWCGVVWCGVMFCCWCCVAQRNDNIDNPQDADDVACLSPHAAGGCSHCAAMVHKSGRGVS